MRHAQVLVYEADGRLAELLRPLALDRGLWLREVRQPAACLGLLRDSDRAVLVLKVGRDLEREIGLLERVTGLFPETAVIVLCDSGHAGLPGLAWDLGAHFVLTPPHPVEWLPELVEKVLPSTAGP